MEPIFKFTVASFCFLWVLINVLSPSAALVLLGYRYFELSAKCTLAMDQTWFADKEDNVKLDLTSNVMLLICHEYDKTRKIMLSMGVNEDVLSYLNLLSSETHQKTISDLSDPHRFLNR